MTRTRIAIILTGAGAGLAVRRGVAKNRNREIRTAGPATVARWRGPDPSNLWQLDLQSARRERCPMPRPQAGASRQPCPRRAPSKLGERAHIPLLPSWEKVPRRGG